MSETLFKSNSRKLFVFLVLIGMHSACSPSSDEYYNLGEEHFKQSELDEALIAFGQARESDPLKVERIVLQEMTFEIVEP